MISLSRDFVGARSAGLARSVRGCRGGQDIPACSNRGGARSTSRNMRAFRNNYSIAATNSVPLSHICSQSVRQTFEPKQRPAWPTLNLRRADELCRVVLQVDDLVQPRSEQIARFLCSRAFSVVSFSSDAARESCFANKGNFNGEIASFRSLRARNLAITASTPEIDSRSLPSRRSWTTNLRMAVVDQAKDISRELVTSNVCRYFLGILTSIARG
jgi:hypothetical protein